MKDNFLFSVVMPVYNVEQYLAEALDSIIGQTAGFEDKTQIILINDGSTDNSASVCLKYRDMYPENIEFIDKENGGVSSARNTGLKRVKGKYVNFIDSDDLWSENTFEAVEAFFRANPEIRIAICQHEYFGNAARSNHRLSYLCEKTRSTDIFRDYKTVAFNVTKSFIDADLLKGRAFDESLRIGEDVVFLNKIILDEGKFGTVHDAIYYYRRRYEKNSVSDSRYESLDYYTEVPDKYFKELIRYSVSRYGEVIRYIQCLLLTDMEGTRLNRSIPEFLSGEQRARYLNDIREVLSCIEDKVILEHPIMNNQYKSYVLRLKYGEDNYGKNSDLKRSMAKKVKVTAGSLFADESLIIKGRADEKSAGEEYCLFAKDNKGNVWYPEYRACPDYDRTGIAPDLTVRGYEHVFSIPLKDKAKYSFYITDGTWNKRVAVSNGRDSQLTGYKSSFFKGGSHIIKLEDNQICVFDYRLRTYLASARRYNKELASKTSQENIALRKKIIRKKLFNRRPLCLVVSVPGSGPDKTEELFRHLKASEECRKYDIRFVGDSADEAFDRMGSYGKTVPFGSDEHKELYALASAVVLPEENRQAGDPYGKDRRFFRDLFEHKTIETTDQNEIGAVTEELLRIMRNQE